MKAISLSTPIHADRRPHPMIVGGTDEAWRPCDSLNRQFRTGVQRERSRSNANKSIVDRRSFNDLPPNNFGHGRGNVALNKRGATLCDELVTIKGHAPPMQFKELAALRSRTRTDCPLWSDIARGSGAHDNRLVNPQNARLEWPRGIPER